MSELAGKVAVVTGAGSGIGRACAAAFAAAGAAVVANDLVAGGLEQTLADVQSAGGTAVAAVGEVRRPDGVRALVAQARTTFGGPDVMGAHAAGSGYPALEEAREE